VFYNRCHMMVAASTPESRVNWIADLDRLAALNRCGQYIRCAFGPTV
jgi:hypothetical protein